MFLGNKAKKDEIKAAQNDPSAIAQRQLIQQLSQYGAQAGGYGTDFLNRYKGEADQQFDWLHKLLSDDNSEALKQIAPDVRARQNQTQAMLQRADMMPRGGGKYATVANIYQNQDADILSLLTNARNAGRQNLFQLMGDMGSRGQGLLSSASGSTGNAASMLGSIVDRNNQIRQGANAQNGAGAFGSGQDMAQLLMLLLSAA
jgi:hypothetical protein